MVGKVSKMVGKKEVQVTKYIEHPKPETKDNECQTIPMIDKEFLENSA
jgi:hypothetical protein